MPAFEKFKHPSMLKQRKRKGRGISSGSGKTSGRGQTGQKSRAGGNIHPRFEGAQTPNIRKFPKMGGFKHHRKIYYSPVNLSQFSEVADGTVVDLAYLAEHRLLPKKIRGLRIKLLGDGEISKKVDFKLHAFSHQAKAKVEKAGGTCEAIQ